MTLRSALFSGAALSALAAPAFALTADEVWQNQTGYLGSLGFAVEATPLRDGSTVEMSDVRFVWTVPMGIGEVIFATPDVTLTENADGTVAISYPAKFRVSIRANLTIEGDAGTAGVDIGVRLDNHSAVASGTPQAVKYVAQTGLLDIMLDRIVLEGEAGDSGDVPEVDMIFTMRDMASETTISDLGAAYAIDSVSTGGQSVFEFSFDDGYGTTSRTVGALDTTRTSASITVPKTPLDWLNLTAALRDGLSIDVQSETVGSRQQTVATSNGNTVSDQSQTVERSSQTLAFGAAGIAISGNAQGLTMDLTQGDMMPFPVGFAIEEASGGFAFPLLAETTPQPVSFGMTLRGVSIGDNLWSMLDAGGVLPHDPATLAFSLDTEVINRVDMLDLMAWEGVADQIDSGQIPADIVSLRISGVEASAVGATLTGEGAFTFDNADRMTIPGIPRPEGQATAQITGLYGVLDKLAQTGLIPPEAGMGARAAIGMFAQATGEDQLSSTFAIGPDGAMTINGAPIPMP